MPAVYDPNSTATGPKEREEEYWIWLPLPLIPAIAAAAILIGILSVEVVIAQSHNHQLILHFYQVEEHSMVTHNGIPLLLLIMGISLLWNAAKHPSGPAFMAVLMNIGAFVYFMFGVFPTLKKFIHLRLPRDEAEYEQEFTFLHHSHEHFILLYMAVIASCVRPHCNWAAAKKKFEEEKAAKKIE